jgi:CIC family chloride channel protein
MSEPHHSPPPSKPWRWFPEFLELGRERFRAQGRLLGSCVLIGIVAGLGAVLFSIACQLVVHYTLEEIAGYKAQAPAYEARVSWLPETARPFVPWLLLIVPTLGGIVTALLVFTWAPEAEGHGTDAAIDAYHNKQGFIRPRVPLIKLVASAVTIGTGGSGGREGPIAQIGAGFGSVLGRLLRMPPASRRVLMAAGVGAGIAAIFRAPLAGALFAAEVLYRSPEFESEVIIPAGIGSVVAYCTFGIFFGWEPLFRTPPGLTFNDPLQLVPYTLLGLAMAVLAMLYTRTFNGLTYLFHQLPLSPYFKPPLGAFLSGLVGLVLYLLLGDQQVLSVLSFGYGVLQQGMDMQQAVAQGMRPGEVTAWLLLAVALGKILTTSLTIGSGGSGGVFGPSMVIGGCGGGALGLLLHHLDPHLVPQPTTFMIVGMAGFFAAAGKVPFSTLVMVSELTGNYLLLLPALWVCSLAYLLSDEQSLYQSQVEDRSHSPAHQGRFVREALAGLQVRQFLTPGSEVPLVRPADPLPKLIELLGRATFSVLPVVDEDRRLLGVVVLDEVYLASQSPHVSPWVLAADLMRSPISPLQPGDGLERAQELFVQNDLRALPVVEDLQTRRVIGMVRRSDVARTYLRHLHGPSMDGEKTARKNTKEHE